MVCATLSAGSLTYHTFVAGFEMVPSTTSQLPKPSLSSLCLGIPLGVAIGGVNALLIRHPVDAFIGFLLDTSLSPFIAVFVSGIIAGALQGAFLRSYTRPVIIWLGASGIGWLLAYSLMRYFYTTTDTSTILPTVSEIFLGVGMGVLAGTAQWLVLQVRWRTAYWWIVSTVFWWAIVWAGTTYFFYAIGGPAL
jgi:hypothetical protein